MNVSEGATRIQGLLRSLVRRERWLLVMRVGARVALLWLTIFAFNALATVMGVERGFAALFVMLAAGIGMWLLLFLPVASRWGASGDPLSQARAVERLKGSLRGRLVTAVAAMDTGASSTSLGSVVVRSAADEVNELQPADVYDGQSTFRWVLGAAVGWALGIPALLFLSGGPDRLVGYWSADAATSGPTAQEFSEDESAHSQVGDIVLRYTYPSYTGLEPHEVPNSTGDAQGPPGTQVEVSLRAASAVRAASLVAYDETFEAEVTEDGRTVVGRFDIRATDGEYRLLLLRGDQPEPTRSFAISAIADLPPEVVLEPDRDRIEVAMGEMFSVSWIARDDFGLRKVALAVNGQERGPVLAEPTERVVELSEDVSTFRPDDLGLKPGDEVQLSVIAWDNDTVSGSKPGISRQVPLVVLGPRQLDERAEELQRELISKMLPVLARFLTEKWPITRVSRSYARWGEVVAKRYDPVVETVETIWSTSGVNSLERAVANRVVKSGRDLVRYTQTSFEPHSSESVPDASLAIVNKLRDEAITSLEVGILTLHQLRRNRALEQLLRQSEELEQLAAQMERDLESEELDPQGMLAQLDLLERVLESVDEGANQLDPGGLREFLTLRTSEAGSLMEEVRDAVARDEMEEARQLMGRTSQLVEEIGRGIQEENERRRRQATERDNSAEDLLKELQELEADQRRLQSEVNAVRERDKPSAEATNQLWERIEREGEGYLGQANRFREEIEQNDRLFYERERTNAAADEAEDLMAAIRARDVRGARRSINQSRRAWSIVRFAFERERSRGASGRPGLGDISRMEGRLNTLDELLTQLEQAERQVSPNAAREGQRLGEDQRDLDKRLEQAAQQAQAFQEQMPIPPEGLEEALSEAQDRMEQASEDLESGALMQAEGSQGVATLRIRDAIQAIIRAQQQARQSQQQSQQRPSQDGQNQSGGEDARPELDGRTTDSNLRISSIEESRDDPEEYRRQVVEGMSGEVPREYRAMKRRYFEELVRQ